MGKDLIMRTLNHEEFNGNVPWVPFAGVHAGKLKGYNAKEMLTDADKPIDCLKEVCKMYEPDGLPIMFDLQLEAEIIGCDLVWADYNPPSVGSHPFDKEKGIPGEDKFPTADKGRLPVCLKAMKTMDELVGDDVAIYGLFCGPLTLSSHLRGNRFFTDTRKDPEYVKQIMDYCAEYSIRMTDLYLENGADVIAVVDPLVSQVSPKVFHNLFHDAYKKIFDHIRARGAKSAFFVCGNATFQIDVMCQTGPDSIAVDENVDMVAAKVITDQYNIALSGNIPLTTTMLFGNQQDNTKGVLDLMDSIENKTNFIVSPGCDMPYDVPVENTIACANAVHHPDLARNMVADYNAGDSFADIEIEVPDYANMDKVCIELMTLDPEQCAACTYMVGAVEDAYPYMKDIAEYHVYKYCVKEDVARTMKYGCKNLPTMMIDGEQVYISIVPNRDELIAKVKEFYDKKH